MAEPSVEVWRGTMRATRERKPRHPSRLLSMHRAEVSPTGMVTLSAGGDQDLLNVVVSQHEQQERRPAMRREPKQRAWTDTAALVNDAEEAGRHKLVQGCSTADLDVSRFGRARFEQDDQNVGKVVCCTKRRNNVNASRRLDGWCMSGQDDENLKTYVEAKTLCHAQGKRLCRSTDEVDLACGPDCGYDTALVWISERAPTTTSTTTASLAAAEAGGNATLAHVVGPVMELAGTRSTTLSTLPTTTVTTLAPALAWNSETSETSTDTSVTEAVTTTETAAPETESTTAPVVLNATDAGPALPNPVENATDAEVNQTAVDNPTAAPEEAVQANTTVAVPDLEVTTTEPGPALANDASETTEAANDTDAPVVAAMADETADQRYPHASPATLAKVQSRQDVMGIAADGTAEHVALEGLEVEVAQKREAARRILQAGLVDALAALEANSTPPTEEMVEKWRANVFGEEEVPPSLHSSLLLSQVLLDGGSVDDIKPVPEAGWNSPFVKLIGCCAAVLAFLY